MAQLFDIHIGIRLVSARKYGCVNDLHHVTPVLRSKSFGFLVLSGLFDYIICQITDEMDAMDGRHVLQDGNSVVYHDIKAAVYRHVVLERALLDEECVLENVGVLFLVQLDSLFRAPFAAKRHDKQPVPLGFECHQRFDTSRHVEFRLQAIGIAFVLFGLGTQHATNVDANQQGRALDFGGY